MAIECCTVFLDFFPTSWTVCWYSLLANLYLTGQWLTCTWYRNYTWLSFTLLFSLASYISYCLTNSQMIKRTLITVWSWSCHYLVLYYLNKSRFTALIVWYLKILVSLKSSFTSRWLVVLLFTQTLSVLSDLMTELRLSFSPVNSQWNYNPGI